MLNVICLLILIAMAVVLILMSIRARGLRTGILRWAAVGSSAVLALSFAATASVLALGLHRLTARNAPVPDLKIVGSPDEIRRGRAIVDSFCGICHSKTGTLAGGSDLSKKLPVPIGSLVASNLTPAGALKHWSDGQIFRAIRNGVDANGYRLFIMSLTSAGNLSDDDIAALIAYIRSVPAIGAETPEPPDQFNPLGLAMLGAGLLPGGRPVFGGVIKAPEKGATAEYGEYLVSYLDCRNCHGEDLAGGRGGLAPAGPGLSLVKDWTREQFIAALRTGIDPGGHAISAEKMPWAAFGTMDDADLGAIYAYLVQLPGAPGSMADRDEVAH